MNTKHYKNCQNNHKYLDKYECDEFIIDRKIRQNYRRYRKNIITTTSNDSDSFVEVNEKQETIVKNSSVKKVIEKFNRLCCNPPRPHVCEVLVLKPPAQIKISTHEMISEKSERVSVSYEQKGREEKEYKRVNKKIKPKKSVKKYDERHTKKSSARKLRCSEKIKCNPLGIENSECFNMFKVPDEYIRFIDDVRRRNIIKYTPKNTLENLHLSKNELKKFKSTKTQTSPYPSHTNILINVYNAPDPAIFNKFETCNNSLRLRVTQDDQLKLSIMEEPHYFQNDTLIEVKEKKSVRNCIQAFEEFMKSQDISHDKKILTNKTKNEIKYKRNHLTEDASPTLLSPRAKTVPF